MKKFINLSKQNSVHFHKYYQKQKMITVISNIFVSTKNNIKCNKLEKVRNIKNIINKIKDHNNNAEIV
jgi:hypothetical protein